MSALSVDFIGVFLHSWRTVKTPGKIRLLAPELAAHKNRERTFVLGRLQGVGESPLPSSLRARVDQELGLLLHNLRHPSLRAKKYDEPNDLWQARVTQTDRFYFQ